MPTWVLWLRFSHKTSAGAAISSEGWTGEGCTSKLTHVVIGRIQFLIGYWTEDLRSLLAGGQSLSQFFSTWVSPLLKEQDR